MANDPPASLPSAGDEVLAEGLALVRAGLERLATVDCRIVGDAGVLGRWEELERLGRALSARQAVLLGEIDARALHRADGHNSVRTMARYKAKLSRGEAARREQSMRVCRDLPAVASAWQDGELSDCHVALLARVYANRRVSRLMPDAEDWFLEQVTVQCFGEFDARVREWQRLADQDGPEPRDHESRDARLVQNDYDLSWDLTGHWASLEGASLNEIFEHYIHAEWLADWEKAKAEHGEATCEADLARTPPQRRADALAQIFRDAAANPDGAVPARFVHNIVWTAATFETMVCRLAGQGKEGEPAIDPDDYRCSTIDGVPIDATEAVVNALLNQVRRVIIDAPSTVIDLGRARSFTGSACDAVQLQATHCVWPGCTVPTTRCETDHLVEHAKHGRTNPTNGAPVCGRHNRWKQKGFSVSRDPTTGRWRTNRPDGTQITPIQNGI